MTTTTSALDSSAVNALRDRLKGPRPGPLLAAMLFDYAVLSVAIVGMLMLQGSIWFWAALPVAWIVIAARQHALLVLMHEATHSLAHPTRWVNEFWGEVLLGAPMLVSMRKYRKDHLAHHRHANTDADPDWVRKLGTPAEARYWQFPVPGNGFGFLARSWLGSIAYLLRSFTHLSNAKQEPLATGSPDPMSVWIGRARIGFYLAVVTLLTVYGGWWAFVLLWLAPILLVLPMIMRLRSIAEHFALSYRNDLTSTRTIVCGPLERFLFGPHRISYHLEHHQLASVSFSQLPQLHAALMQMPGYRQQAHVNDGYLLGQQSLRNDLLQPVRDVLPGVLPSRSTGATSPG